jgi:hypothetical protein
MTFLAHKMGLVTIDKEGSVFTGTTSSDLKSFNQTTKKMCFAAEKIGNWFAPLSIKEIATILHINF